MRDYSIVSGRFWIGETGKSLRNDQEAQLLAMYLITSPHASMTGLYYCPMMYVSQDTGIPVGNVKAAMERLCDLGFCLYDDDSETVFVIEMARFQIAEELAVKDNRRVAVIRELDKISSPFVPLFVDKYGEAFNLDVAIYPSVPHWKVAKSTVIALSERDGRRCRHCDATENLAVDHIIARINGGRNDLPNLQFLCTSCNSKKAAQDRKVFWESVDGQTLLKGGTPPLHKGSGLPSRSQDQDQDQDQDQEQEHDRGHAAPRSADAAGAVLDLGLPESKPAPPSDASSRLVGIWKAMQTEEFLVPGTGDQTMWDNVKRPQQLAKKLDTSCPGVNIPALIGSLAGWTYANPKRAKRDLGRFVWNAAKREQDSPRSSPTKEGYRSGVDLADKVRRTKKGGRG